LAVLRLSLHRFSSHVSVCFSRKSSRDAIHRLNGLTNVLHPPVEIATLYGHSPQSPNTAQSLEASARRCLAARKKGGAASLMPAIPRH